MDDIDATDPQLLKTVGQDTVSFALRIGASSLSAAEYTRLRFPELAKYVFELMASLQGGRLDTQTVMSGPSSLPTASAGTRTNSSPRRRSRPSRLLTRPTTPSGRDTTCGKASAWLLAQGNMLL